MLEANSSSTEVNEVIEVGAKIDLTLIIDIVAA